MKHDFFFFELHVTAPEKKNFPRNNHRPREKKSKVRRRKIISKKKLFCCWGRTFEGKIGLDYLLRVCLWGANRGFGRSSRPDRPRGVGCDKHTLGSPGNSKFQKPEKSKSRFESSKSRRSPRNT